MPKSVFHSDILKGKVALITGGGSGICYGIAQCLGQHGAKIAVMGRRGEVLEAACQQLRTLGIDSLPINGDVREPEQAKKAVADTVRQWGRLDILVNGAAGNFLCPAEELSPNAFKTVVDIDLNGTWNMCHAAFAALKNSRGVILNISATLHYMSTLWQLHVSAAKAGIDALTKNLAGEWGEYGIRTCAIAPGPVGDTEGMRRLAPGEAGKALAKRVPLKRLGEIQDIANAAIFLVSDAASFINGEILVVDGGEWLAREPFVPKEQVLELMKKSRSEAPKRS